jgi:hypothetical protein
LTLAENVDHDLERGDVVRKEPDWCVVRKHGLAGDHTARRSCAALQNPYVYGVCRLPRDGHKKGRYPNYF